MSKRSWSWILVCLLLLAGAWLFWPSGNRHVAQKSAAAKKQTVTMTRSASTAPLLLSSGRTATNGVVKTNSFAYRLTNTKKPIGRLANDPHAILLENALMDTSIPLNFSIPKNLQAQGDPGAYIVQANGLIDAAFRATLAAAGAQIVSYIPNNAYLVTLSAGGAAGLSGRPGVQSVKPYEPYYKISAALLGLAVEQKNLPDNTVLTLGLFPNTASQTVDQIKQLGGTVVATDQSPFGPIVRVTPPKNWTALAVLPGVQIMELAHRRALANDLARVTLAISTDTVTNADYMNLFGSNVLVEVNDTGIDANHPDFTTGGSPGTGPGGAPVRVTGDSALSLVDVNGHGTHVAGIIAGNGDESYSVPSIPQGSVTNADFRGKARAASLYSVAALNDSGNLDIPDSYLQSVPAQTNALISNNSWGYVGDTTYDLAAASYDAAVRDALPLVTGSQPVLFVFAAGNDGGGDDGGGSGDPDTILSPGTAKNVITVGALEQDRGITNTYTPLGTTNQVTGWLDGTSSSFEVASYSSRGNVGIGTEGAFGRFKPDVVAPGSSVVSTRSEQWDQPAYYNPTNDNFTVFPDFVQPQSTSDPNSASFFVFNNSPVVTIQLEAVATATAPLTNNLIIYVWAGTDPNTAAPILAGTNFATIPTTLLDVDTGWSCAVSNPNTATVSYNLVVDVLTTNDLGDFFTVLSNLNNTVGPWYRYESGTSMATPAVSGSLALIQDYFTNTLHATPSPALLKAMLINGARSVGSYDFTVTNEINFQGWGLANVPDSVPPGLTNQLSVACSELFLDQNVTNTLATGDSQTYLVTVTNSTAQDFPLRVTLAWTDPPGNPAAAIKLVNNLDLVVSNTVTGTVYFGNDIPSGSTFNQAWDTNAAPNLDTINNVENVFLDAIPSGSYTVTVLGRSVNVNAVTAQTNNVVQDYALVIAYGEGEVTNAITVMPGTPSSVSDPTSDQQITTVLINANGMATNSSNGGGVFLNQLAGANTPLLGTNTVGFAAGTNDNFVPGAVVTAGMTNQWHFYVVQNTTGFSNAAFVTFLSDTLSVPRMGVFADPTQNPTQPEADIDLYVSSDPSLTNLNPVVISNCVNGTQVGMSVAGTFNGASLSSGGTEFVVDSNAGQGQVYYVGVKSETAIAAEYGFLPVFSQQPFSQSGPNGETVNGLLLPMNIPDGSTPHPGTAYIFALAIQPIEVQDVIVSNEIVHEDFGDLVGTLSHNGKGVVLHSHELLGNPPGPYSFIYDDGLAPVPGSQRTAGPGNLAQFQGEQGVGPWILTEVDNASPGVGYVTNFNLLITPHLPLNQGVNISVQPFGYFYGFIDAPAGATNLTISATNISGTTLDPTGTPLVPTPPGQLFEKLGEQPAPPPTPLTNFDKMVTLTNAGPLGPGGSIIVGPSDVPPIEPGRYYVTLYNPTASSQRYFIIATLGIGQAQPVDFNGGGSVPLLDDAVTYASIFNFPDAFSTNETIATINVGVRVDHSRISDLVFTLISPDGTRYLLMENRGNTSTNGAGLTLLSTNIANVTSTGSSGANTNFIPVGLNAGLLTINYNFFTIPDQMTVYLGTNIFDFTTQVFDTGMTNGIGQFNVSFPVGTGNLTIIMNQFGNTNGPAGGDLWTYTAGGVQTNFVYLTFTDDTNLTTTPIKFAPTPFVPSTASGILWTDSFEAYTPGLHSAPASIGGAWTVQANSVEIVQTPTPADGINLLQLDNGAVSTTLPTVAGRQYILSYELGSRLAEGVGPVTNANWQPQSVTFLATQNSTPLVLIASGTTLPIPIPNAETLIFDTNALLDAFSLTAVPGDLYYQPEQDLSPLIGTSAYGKWQLEIQDDRVGATNLAPALLGWQLQFVFADTNPAPAILTPGTEICNTTPANNILWYQVNVPLNALFATNTLFPAGLPMNLLFNQTSASTNGATVLLTNSPGGISILASNSVPPLVPGSTYYLGVQNPNGVPVDACIEVDFNLLATAFAFTEPAQLVTGTSAQLNGFATPNGNPSAAWFQWGTNTLYGNQTPPTPVGAGYSVVYVTNSIINLVTNVPYHFRLVVSNALGVVYGFDQILDEANVVAWGANYAGQLDVPTNLNNVVAIAGAYDHNLALKTNGQVVAWGDNTFGQATVPAGLSNAVMVAVAGGEYYSIALKSDSTVASWGANLLSQTNVPAGLSNVVTIAGGTYSSLALQNNGNVVAWGANFFGLTNVPASASNIVAVAGGSYHSLALRNDGTVLVWGDDSSGQTNVPAGLNNVVAIAAGGYHSLALKYDGTVVAWGDDSVGQTNVPAGLSNVVAIAAGGFHSLAMRADGTMVTWGDDSAGQASVPVGLTNVVAISAGYLHSLALTPQVVTNGIILPLVPGVPQTNTIFAGGIIYYQVNVPTNADFATNTLLFANNGPLNIWFSTNTPPTLATRLATGVTNGVWILSSPVLVPGSIYYLGVQNTNSFTVNYGIEVDFHLITPVIPPPFTNIITISSIVHTNGGFLLTWFAPSNDLFQVQWSASLPPVWQTFTNIVSFNPAFYTNGPVTQFNFFDDGSQTPPGLPPIRFYQLIQLGSLLNLSNGVPQTAAVAPGSTAYYSFTVPANADAATNTLLSATAPVNLLFNQTGLPTGTNTGGYTLLANSLGGSNILSAASMPPLVPGATYYLGVQNTNTVPVTFTLQVNFHLATAPPTVPTPSVTFTNGVFLLTWFAPTNDIFLVQWSDSLPPVNWNTFTNIIIYTNGPTATPAQGKFTFTDDGTQTGGFAPTRFYNLILLGSLSNLTNGQPQTTTVPGGSTAYYLVTVPANADFATNTLISAGTPVNLLFNQNTPPTGTNAGDYKLLANATGGSTNLSVTTVPPLVPGTTYYLAVQNTNTVPVTFTLQVNFHLVTATFPAIYPVSSVVYSGGNFLLNWLAPTNDIFTVQVATNLATPTWQTIMTNITYTGPLTATNGLFSYTDTGTQVPFGPIRFYQLLLTGVAAPSISGFTVTTNGLNLTWSAPTNDQFQVAWATNLFPPVAWTPFPNIITSTNGIFSFTDTNTPLLMKFYELILLP